MHHALQGIKLQILIAQYRETEQTIDKMLTSIALQQGVDLSDIEVLICNDGSDVILRESFLKSYPYRIRYIRNEHRGVSHTRNTLLDTASAEYIMNADADDMFFNMFGLHMIFEAISKHGFDVMTSAFVGERRDTGFRKLSNDADFIHGKVFRLEYLRKNNIRWCDPITFSGDTYFLGLALNSTNSKIYCDVPFYLWCWNNDSICRREDNHFIRAFPARIRADDALIDEYLRRGMKGDAGRCVARTAYELYFITNMPEWDNAGSYETVRLFGHFYRKYKDLFETMQQDERAKMYQQATSNYYRAGVYRVKMPFDDWIKQEA